MLDMSCEREVEGSDYCRFWAYSCVGVVFGGINGVSLGKSIRRGHFRPRCDLPDDIKVLQEQGPSGLSSGQFARVSNVG